jgi:hypothetical protein
MDRTRKCEGRTYKEAKSSLTTPGHKSISSIKQKKIAHSMYFMSFCSLFNYGMKLITLICKLGQTSGRTDVRKDRRIEPISISPFFLRKGGGQFTRGVLL